MPIKKRDPPVIRYNPPPAFEPPMPITKGKKGPSRTGFRIDLLVAFVAGVLCTLLVTNDRGLSDCLGSSAITNDRLRKFDAEERITTTAITSNPPFRASTHPPPTAALVTKAAAAPAASNGQAPPKLSFLEIAGRTSTDKIAGHSALAKFYTNPKDPAVVKPGMEKNQCKIFGHFYDTIYDRWLAPFAMGDEPMQLLEIGYYRGQGFEAFTNYLGGNPNAELHSMEMSCLPEGPIEEGKWPWGNFALKHPWYQKLRDSNRLHCGDASDYKFLQKTWTTHMKRPDAPPLRVVVEDASHLAKHMAASLFFWFPRIAPGGILVVEDIQHSNEAKDFRVKLLPQIMKDVHWCGGDQTVTPKDSVCFPELQKLLQGVHCEMHICVFVRNSEPASEPDEEGSVMPGDALVDTKLQKCLFGPH